MYAGNAENHVRADIAALLHRDEVRRGDRDARVLVYTLPHVLFKGATVCLGYRVFYGEEAHRRLVGLVPQELRDAVKPVVMSVEEFLEAKDGYFVGGLVFLEADDSGRLYVQDPDTDGKVYLPALVAYHPRPIYSFEMVPLEQIRPVDELRYRRSYDVEDLAENIRRFGLLSPLVVYRDKKAYRLVAGYRRYYALKRLGWPCAPCLVLNMPPETQNLVPLVENFFRSQPSREEYARLVGYIMNSGGYSSIYELLRLLNVRDRRTVLRLLKETGIRADPERAVDGAGAPQGDGALRLLVERLMDEAESRPLADGYDPETILLRIEKLDEPQPDGSAGPAPDGSGGELGAGVGLLELPLDLLNRLAAYLGAEDAEEFRRKLAALLEAIVGCVAIAVLKGSDKGVLAKLRELSEKSGGALLFLEPQKI